MIRQIIIFTFLAAIILTLFTGCGHDSKEVLKVTQFTLTCETDQYCSSEGISCHRVDWNKFDCVQIYTVTVED